MSIVFTGFAQDNSSHTLTSGATLHYPSTWQIQPLPQGIALRDDAHIMIVMTQPEILALTGLDDTATDEALMQGLFEALIAAETALDYDPDRLTVFEIGQREALRYTFEDNLATMLFLVLPLRDGSRSFVQAFALNRAEAVSEETLAIIESHDAAPDAVISSPEAPENDDAVLNAPALIGAFNQLQQRYLSPDAGYTLLYAETWRIEDDNGIVLIYADDAVLLIFSPAVLARDGFGAIDDPVALLEAIGAASEWQIRALRGDATDPFVLADVAAADGTLQLAGSRVLSNSQPMLFILAGNLSNLDENDLTLLLASLFSFERTRGTGR